MIKFVHIADLHLDSPFSGCSMQERSERRNELKNALLSVVSYCLDSKTDLLLICGDLFDGDFAGRTTAVFVADCLSKIPRTRVFITPGNHDPYCASSPYKYCNFPDNVHIFTGESLESVEIPELGCAVYGFGYTSQRMSENPVLGIHPHNTSRINILMAHGDIDDVSSPYYNISSADIGNSGLDYVALGHIHKPSGLMHYGRTACAYSGCLVGRDFGECGTRGMIVGEIDVNGTKISYIPVSSTSYEEITVDITGKDLSTIISETAEKCRDFSDKTRVRIVLCGERDNPIPLSEALLREYLPLLAGTEILDKTTEKLNYTELMKEYSLRGAFARNLRPYLESSDGSVREKGILALKYGLEALKK